MNKDVRKRKAQNYDMRNIISYISRDLRSNDTDALKFLLVGTLPKPYLTPDKTALVIFEALEEHELLSEESPWLLIQCLQKINRNDLVHKFFRNILDMKPSFPSGEISQYRLTLFHIGINLGETDQEYLMHLFKDNIPKSTREKMTTSFQLLIFLEEKNMYHQEETETLVKALRLIDRKDLARTLQVSAGTSKDSLGRLVQQNAGKKTKSTFEIRLKDSVIKGFHVYQIIPPLTNPPIRLHVGPENGNPWDDNACFVKTPPIEDIPNSVKAAFDSTEYCSEFAGKVVGSVPWGLSKTFRFILEMGCEIYAEVTDEPCESFPPWPERFEKGGGDVIPCDFCIACPDEDMQLKAKKSIKYALKTMSEKDAMTVC